MIKGLYNKSDLSEVIKEIKERRGGEQELEKPSVQEVRPTVIQQQCEKMFFLRKKAKELKESVSKVLKEAKEYDAEAKRIDIKLKKDIGDAKVLVKINGKLFLLAVEKGYYEGDKKLKLEKFIMDEDLEKELMLKKLKKAK